MSDLLAGWWVMAHNWLAQFLLSTHVRLSMCLEVRDHKRLAAIVCSIEISVKSGPWGTVAQIGIDADLS